jgi:hypothetical protein
LNAAGACALELVAASKLLDSGFIRFLIDLHARNSQQRDDDASWQQIRAELTAFLAWPGLKDVKSE